MRTGLALRMSQRHRSPFAYAAVRLCPLRLQAMAATDIGLCLHTRRLGISRT